MVHLSRHVSSFAKVSVAIITYNRPMEVRRLLNMLLHQTAPINEVIIVDDSSDDATQRVVSEISRTFETRGIKLRYVKKRYYSLPPSASLSRLIGGLLSQGDIIVFLDDDVLIPKNFIEELLRVYIEKPEAVAVSGFYPPPLYLRLRHRPVAFKVLNEALRLLGFEYYSIDKSDERSYPYILTTIKNIERFHGACFSVRKEVLKKVNFDKHLLYGSYGEDLLFSIPLAKTYKGRVYMTPYALCFPERKPKCFSKREIFRRLTYVAYTYSKINRLTQGYVTAPKLIHIILHVWIKDIAPLVGNSSSATNPLKVIVWYFLALKFVMNNLHDIISGNIRELNEKISNIE